MKKTILFFISILIAGILMAQTPKTATENNSTIAILDSFANAFNAHDIDRIMSYLTHDCVFEALAGPDVNGEKFEGKEAVKKAFEDVFRTYRDAHWANARHFISGDRLFQSGHLQEQNKKEIKGGNGV